MKFFRSSLEKDFDFFVRNLTILEPIEFCGLAKIFGIKLDKEEKDENDRPVPRPLEEVLEELMDKFLSLSKRRRKEII